MRVVSLVLLSMAMSVGLVAGFAADRAAADSHCPNPGGAADDLPDFEPAGLDADWVLEGRGWGHGAGMSQYGALGAAQAGCDATTILEAYFPGATVGPLPVDEPPEVRVSLLHGESHEAGWERADVDLRASDAEAADVVWESPDGTTHTQTAGSTWRLEQVDDESLLDELDGDEEGPWRLVDDDGDTVWSGGDPPDDEPGARVLLVASLDGAPAVELPGKGGRAYGEGTLRFEFRVTEDDDGEEVHRAYPSVAIGSEGARTALDRYLHGLREVPRSWPAEALKAQVITGRGYAADRIAGNPTGGRGCPDCHLVDSPADQVYAGLSVREGVGGGSWLDAVADTSGQVVVYNGSIAQTFYSSSHGGQSESGAFSAALGVDKPYLQPVDDSAWELAARRDDGGLANPHLAWTREVSDDDVAAAVADATDTDIGDVVQVRLVEPTGAGGRVGSPGQGYGGVEVEGTQSTVTLSGWQFISGLDLETASGGPGLRSELFEIFPGGLARLAGDGRVDTAAEAALDGWRDDGASHVVLATAWDFADALAATAMAAAGDAPVLLTPGTELAPRAATTLEELDTETVTVMGGEAAVSADVVDELEARGYTVDRVAGATRFDTAAEAALVGADGLPVGDLPDELSGGGEVAIALGTDWPDALAAGALGASSDRVPTLLTTSDAVHPATLAALDELDPDTVHLVGGSAVLGDEVAIELADAGYETNRFAGRTRFDTSAQVARDALARDGRDGVVLASGLDFPDALAAGPYSARTEGVLALVAREHLDQSPPVRDLIGEADLTRGVILGGTAAVSDEVRREAARLLPPNS